MAAPSSNGKKLKFGNSGGVPLAASSPVAKIRSAVHSPEKSYGSDLSKKPSVMPSYDDSGCELGMKNGFNPLRMDPKPLRPWHEWTLECFELGRRLEKKGGFGKTFLARTKKEKRIIALKITPLKEIVEGNRQYLVNRETTIHSKLNHSNINKMYGFFLDHRLEAAVYVMAYEPGGNVYDELQAVHDNRFSNGKAATYVYQVTLALEYLHSFKIIHRNIKPESLLIGYFGEIKLSNFDCSVENLEGLPDMKYRRSICGTKDYEPPEMVAKTPYNEKVDLWSVGVLIHEFLIGSGSLPTINKVNANKVDIQRPRHLTYAALDILTKTLRTDPAQRLPLREIQEHSWITLNAKRIPSKKLLPRFDKYAFLEETLKKKYKMAKDRIISLRGGNRRASC